MSGGGRNQCVKVVIINTKYVETDAMSFKDVVQKLTGKDSMVAYEPEEPFPKSQSFLRDHQGIINHGRTNNVVESSSNTTTNSIISSNNCVNGMAACRSNSSVLMRNISFKEFERLFREMPPMEDLWTDF